jgi:hypothetical protein
MSVQLLLCRGRARGIEDALLAWPRDEARFSGDREAMLRECEGLVEACERMTRDAQKGLFSGAVANVQATGDGVLVVLDQSIAALRQAVQALTAGNGDAVVGYLARAQKLRDGFARRWPFVDEEQVAASREEFAQGKGISLESWLNELQG